MAAIPTLPLPLSQRSGSAKVTRWPMAVFLGCISCSWRRVFCCFLKSAAFPYQALRGWFLIIILAGFPLIIVNQVLRYRSYASPIERQQTKWFVWSLASYAIISTIIGLVSGAVDQISWLEERF